MAGLNGLTYTESPVFAFAGNQFRDVPIILQVDRTPMIEVVKEVRAGYQIQFYIYREDGTELAKVKGTRIFPTEDGKKAGLAPRSLHKVYVCEMEGKTVFELRREQAAALKLSAELYAPNGSFVKVNPDLISGYVPGGSDSQLEIMASIVGNTIIGARIGVLVDSAGGVAVGVG